MRTRRLDVRLSPGAGAAAYANRGSGHMEGGGCVQPMPGALVLLAPAGTFRAAFRADVATAHQRWRLRRHQQGAPDDEAQGPDGQAYQYYQQQLQDPFAHEPEWHSHEQVGVATPSTTHQQPFQHT